MSEIDTFRTAVELEKENLRLQRELRAAMLTVDKLLKDGQQKNEKITHLENMLSQSVPVIQVKDKKISIEVSPEGQIAEMQLERLRRAAQDRVLTLEEIRAFDLLVKNKRLSQDESTINLNKSQFRDVSEADLMQLAAKDMGVPSDSDPS